MYVSRKNGSLKNLPSLVQHSAFSPSNLFLISPLQLNKVRIVTIESWKMADFVSLSHGDVRDVRPRQPSMDGYLLKKEAEKFTEKDLQNHRKRNTGEMDVQRKFSSCSWMISCAMFIWLVVWLPFFIFSLILGC